MLILVYNKHLLSFNLLTSYGESLHLQNVPREREREREGGRRGRGPLVSTIMDVLELM
jgi:hypothetical protein